MAKYWYAALACLSVVLAGWLFYVLALWFAEPANYAHMTAKPIALGLIFFGVPAVLLVRRAFQFHGKSRNFARPSK